MDKLATIDYIIFVLVMIGSIWGAIKGFIEELSSKFGYILGFILAIMFTQMLSEVFVSNFSLPVWFSAFISYVLIFVVGYLMMKAFGSVIKNITDNDAMEVVDRLLGFFLGLLECLLLIGLFEKILVLQNIFNLKPAFEESLFSTKIISPFIDLLLSVIKGFI